MYAGVILSGCVEQTKNQNYDQVKLQKLTKPEILAEDGKPKSLPAGFIVRRLRMGYPTIKDIVVGDRRYVYITDKWFHDIVNWTDAYLKAHVPHIGKNGQHPENYVPVFTSIASNTANLMVGKYYNIHASVLIGIMRVRMVNDWGVISGNQEYETFMVALIKDKGIVYDIKTGQSVTFEKFPNIDFVDGISF